MSKKSTKLALHWKILIGMAAGVLWGYLAIVLGLQDFTINWIKPFGTIFLNALKLIAVPLVLASLIKGVSSLTDVAKLSRIGVKTIAIYLLTSLIAISSGLVIVNMVNPGGYLAAETRQELQERFGAQAADQIRQVEEAAGEVDQGPLTFLIDIVPDNIFVALSDNRLLLQVIFFAILTGIALVLIPREKAKPVSDFFASLNEVVLKLVDIIMLYAPIGVFALLAAILSEVARDSPDKILELLTAVGIYALCVVAGLLFTAFVMYPLLLNILGRRFSPSRFFKAISPAQLLAFSTSSSAAALPVTMERCEENLGISKEVSSFVLPLGATINMDGTGLYLGVAAVFIAQVNGIDLSFVQQAGILLTTLLASIGTAAVPSAGILMLVIVLNSAGLPLDLSLILVTDRLLDMLRTGVNVTGDATVATIIASSENQLTEPKAEG